MSPQKSETSKTEEISKLNTKYENKSGLILGSFYEIPEYFRHNEFIKNGYRLNCNSFSVAVKSLFKIHNETVNIWSHLFGAILFIILIFYTIIFITNYTSQLRIVKSNIYEIEKINNFTKLNDNIEINNFYTSLQNFKKDLQNYSFILLNNAYESMINKISANYIKFKNTLTNKYINLKNSFSDLLKLSNYNIIPEKNLERWPLIIFLISAILCLSFSSFFHLVGNISPQVHRILSRFDYGGISLLITGSCYPPYIYYFYCDVKFKIFYIISITSFGLITFLLCLTNGFNLPEKRIFRGSLFLTFGISSCIPIIHMGFFGYSIKGYITDIRILFWYLGGITYIIGALLYLVRFPEKKYPGKFDYFGSSHQLLHFAVVIAVIFHYIGCLDAYYGRFDNLCYKY